MSFDKNVDEVCQRLQDRSWVGLQKYKVTTEREDLSVEEWLTHLQEELMDATIYIQKLKGEIDVSSKMQLGQSAQVLTYTVQQLQRSSFSPPPLLTDEVFAVAPRITPPTILGFIDEGY